MVNHLWFFLLKEVHESDITYAHLIESSTRVKVLDGASGQVVYHCHLVSLLH